MKTTLDDIRTALSKRRDLTGVKPCEEWGGSVVAKLESPHPALRMTFLAKLHGAGGVLSFLVPNLWRAPMEEEGWPSRLRLGLAAPRLLGKPILSPDGSLHLGLDLPLQENAGLEELVERALAVLRSDLAGLRGTILELAQENGAA